MYVFCICFQVWMELEMRGKDPELPKEGSQREVQFEAGKYCSVLNFIYNGSAIGVEVPFVQTKAH
jgi:hypothetical protein